MGDKNLLTRICPDCKKTIFYKSKKVRNNFERKGSSCRKCTVAKYERNRIAKRMTDTEYKAKMRQYILKSRYGISTEEYNDILKRQEGHCAVCPSTEKLFVDHDHNTELIRGILCRHHNLMLGYMEKDLASVDELFDYLSFNREQNR